MRRVSKVTKKNLGEAIRLYANYERAKGDPIIEAVYARLWKARALLGLAVKTIIMLTVGKLTVYILPRLTESRPTMILSALFVMAVILYLKIMIYSIAYLLTKNVMEVELEDIKESMKKFMPKDGAYSDVANIIKEISKNGKAVDFYYNRLGVREHVRDSITFNEVGNMPYVVIRNIILVCAKDTVIMYKLDNDGMRVLKVFDAKATEIGTNMEKSKFDHVIFRSKDNLFKLMISELETSD